MRCRRVAVAPRLPGLLAVGSLAGAVLAPAGPVRAERDGWGDWHETGCVDAVGVSHAPGRILFRLEPDALPGDCDGAAPLGIGEDQADKRERYAAGLRYLRDLSLALVRGDRLAVRGDACRATSLDAAPPSPDAPVCRALRSFVEPQADPPGPPGRWQCQTRVEEVVRYERGGALRFRTATHPEGCVTQPFLDWRGAPESHGARASDDPDARNANARAALWLLVLAKLEGKLVVVTGRSCETSHLTLWNRRLPPAEEGRCYPLDPALAADD